MKAVRSGKAERWRIALRWRIVVEHSARTVYDLQGGVAHSQADRSNQIEIKIQIQIESN